MKRIGAPVGTPMKRANFKQTNPKKSDFITNNPFPPITESDDGKFLRVSGNKVEYVDAQFDTAVFDLSGMGLSDIAIGGDPVTLEADLSELVATVYSGKASVKVPVFLGNGLNLKLDIILHPTTATEEGFYSVANYDLVTNDSLFDTLKKSPKLWIAIKATKTQIDIRCREVGGEVAGGGTGSYEGDYTVTLTNLLPDRTLSAAEGAEALLKFEYTSVDDSGGNDGDGIGTIFVEEVRAATVKIKQGANALNVAPYLKKGDNSVKIKVENSEGSSKSLAYTVTLVSLSLTSTLSQFTVMQEALTLYYTPVGEGSKTVHFSIDGKEIGTATVASSGRSQSYSIPMQSHGAHILKVYAETTVGGTRIESNTVTICLICIEEGNSTPVIGTLFDVKEATQGETLMIHYFPYDPSSEVSETVLRVVDQYDEEYSSKTINVARAPQMWAAQDYPAGATRFVISIGDTSVSFPVTVTESGVVFEPVSDSLVFSFNPSGRSNDEDNPAEWTDGNVSASFSGIGFSGADGWLDDAEGATVLRLLPGGTVSIPFKLFETDKRANGVTVEVEMATQNVRDYDSIVMSCLSGGRGFLIASQYAQMNSEQSEISMQFKEDERVRVSFVVEPRNLNRLIYVYVDGIMCGALQYPDDDNFAQNPAVGITIGAELSGIDVYRIYLYDKGLTRNEILSNYIADRSTLAQRLAAHERNDIFDVSEEIVISKLPATLPYMVISCPELPQYKGHKKTCDIAYVNPSDSTKSFTASGVEIDVQGTSSAGYKKKNFKFKLKNGLIYTATGTTSGTYALRNDSLPVSVFCLKADVASSESANNVELVRLYNDVVPYKTEPQILDPRVRVGIDGLPIVVFWNNTTDNTTRFWGKYNFNNDKSTPEVFGLTPGCESWEVKNNTSDRVIFKKSDYTGTEWLNDFEGRYPDGNTDYTNLKRLTDWLVSTDRSAVSSDAEKAARLAKFKNEFESYFVKIPTLFYYVFTEAFLMVDSRAKNFFPSTYDGVHWLPLPYDMDTALGINNEGALVFDYDLEDTDRVSDANVFNGQESVLWCNVRDAFPEEIAEMYADLRNGTAFNYAEIVRRFSEHQAVWPEAVWNEDAFEKYLEPLLNDKDGSYLTMLQGDKESQREWWLYNGLRYRDSKYQCGDASTQFITLRCYAVGDITVTPYSHVWPRIKYGSYTVTERGKRNEPTTLTCPLDTMDDTEVYIYSADRLAEIGDLSPMQVGYANFSMAAKLQKLKLGDGAASYQNTHLTELYVGNNDLLAELDIRNCVNLKQAVDLSECSGLEKIYAGGSAVTALTLPVGGKIQTMELPGTITNLTIREQKQLANITLAGYALISTLRIENTPNVPVKEILMESVDLNRVRLIGFDFNADSVSEIHAIFDKLDTCKGLDAMGNNVDKAVAVGVIHVDMVSSSDIADLAERYPSVTIDYKRIGNTATFMVDGVVFDRQVLGVGEQIKAPASTPKKESTDQYTYTFKGWSIDGVNVVTSFGTMGDESVVYYALFTEVVRSYTIRFLNGTTVLQTLTVAYGAIPAYTGTTPTMDGKDFGGWIPDLAPVTGNADYTAKFIAQSVTRGLIARTITEFASDSITTVGQYAFYACKALTSVNIPNATRIESYAFYDCQELTNANVPNVTYVTSSAFGNCYKLKNADFPNATGIGGSAFYYCRELESINMQSATSIGMSAFYMCKALKSVRLPATPPTLGYANSFDSINSACVFYIPTGSLAAYQAATNWSSLTSKYSFVEENR